jgi:hypothetical protein
MSLLKLNPVEPPWYVTRMPGGVGGVAPRGVPLSRSSAHLCRRRTWWLSTESAPKRSLARPCGERSFLSSGQSMERGTTHSYCVDTSRRRSTRIAPAVR